MAEVVGLEAVCSGEMPKSGVGTGPGKNVLAIGRVKFSEFSNCTVCHTELHITSVLVRISECDFAAPSPDRECDGAGNGVGAGSVPAGSSSPSLLPAASGNDDGVRTTALMKRAFGAPADS